MKNRLATRKCILLNKSYKCKNQAYVVVAESGRFCFTHNSC